MSEVEKIKDLLRRAYDGDAWYGPSLRDSLQGVTSEKAMARPIPGAHSIWEIVLHVTAWLGAVRDRLERGVVTLPTEGDWPTISNQTEAGGLQRLMRWRSGTSSSRGRWSDWVTSRCPESWATRVSG